jgi:hypothetical protein
LSGDIYTCSCKAYKLEIKELKAERDVFRELAIKYKLPDFGAKEMLKGFKSRLYTLNQVAEELDQEAARLLAKGKP